MAIDVGPGATDRDSAWGPTITTLALDNPANATGTLDTVELWFNTNGSGMRVGTFFLVSGTTYQCRDSVTIGNVTAGSKQTFSGLTNFDVVVGDYIGGYWTGGNIECSAGPVAYAIGEYIDPGDQGTYTSYTYTISIYGTGTETAVGQPYISRVQGVQGMKSWGAG